MTFLQSRPLREPRPAGVLGVARWIGCASVAVVALIVTIRYDSVPRWIPTDLDASGADDDGSPRWTVWIILGVWALLQVGLAVLAGHPRVFNYPFPVTQTNAQRLYREGEILVVFLGLALAVTFAGLVLTTIGLAALPLVAVGIAGIFVALIVGIVRILAAERG